MENKELRLEYQATSRPSEPVFIDNVTLREVLPTGELGPDILNEDFEDWEWTG